MTRMFALLLTIAATSQFIPANSASPAGQRASQTWTGTISDEVCGTSHHSMATAIGISDRECTIQCTRSGGRYVLVVDADHIIPFVNQTFAGLQEHAAHKVTVTGELQGDAILVSKIEMVAGSK